MKPETAWLLIGAGIYFVILCMCWWRHNGEWALKWLGL